MAQPLAARLAEAASGLGYAGIPAPVVAEVKAAIIDCVGCILSGAEAEETRPVLRVVAEEGGAPQALILGTARRAPLAAAALVNGTAAHALDFDDTSPAWFGHPSVSLVPTILAVGERTGADGRALLSAYVAAYEAVAVLGRRMNPSHYLAGWHATGTLGTIGAAIAAGRLLGLDPGRLATAIGIAASQAAGLRENFGTGVKPLHAGLAARAGVLSALLARAGLTASPAALDGPSGLIAAYSDGDAPAGRFAFQDGDFELARSGISLKPYPCCGAIHTSLDAVFALRQEHGFAADEVESVACTVNEMSRGVLVYPEARTPLEGKFSLQYCIGAALVDGECGLPQFEPARIADPAIQAAARRVTMVVDPALAPGITPSTVELAFADGRRLQRQIEKPKGSIQHPMTADEVRRKFLGCAAVALEDVQAAALHARLADLETLPTVGALLPLLAGRCGQRIEGVS